MDTYGGKVQENLYNDHSCLTCFLCFSMSHTRLSMLKLVYVTIANKMYLFCFPNFDFDSNQKKTSSIWPRRRLFIHLDNLWSLVNGHLLMVAQ